MHVRRTVNIIVLLKLELLILGQGHRASGWRIGESGFEQQIFCLIQTIHHIWFPPSIHQW